MNRAATSVFAWGIYLIGAGVGFLFIPNIILSLFKFSTTTEGWVRVVGLLAAIIGAYYVYCAQNNVMHFIRMTVFGRVAFAVGSLTLVMLKLSETPLLIIGALDAIGAIWTWLSLRSMAEAKVDDAMART